MDLVCRRSREQTEACGVLCTLGPRTLTRDVEEKKGRADTQTQVEQSQNQVEFPNSCNLHRDRRWLVSVGSLCRRSRAKLQMPVFVHTHQLFIKNQTPKKNFRTPLEPNSFKALALPNVPWVWALESSKGPCPCQIYIHAGLLTLGVSSAPYRSYGIENTYDVESRV